MTDMSKYKNVSLTKETYATLDKLSKVLLPDAKLSIAKTIESIANEKAKKLNGKIKNKQSCKDDLQYMPRERVCQGCKD